MKKRAIIVVTVVLYLLILVGCRNTPGSSPSVVKGALSASSGNVFSIYLLEGKIPPSQMDPDEPLELEAQPLISMDDIVVYSKSTHEIQLTEQGYEKIHALNVPTNGMAFAVCVDDEPFYTGAFWVLYSSLSYDGIVIDPLKATAEDPILQITLGYPGSTFFQAEDLRSDPGIMDALEKAGKLK